jgi:hypothetical protein
MRIVAILLSALGFAGAYFAFTMSITAPGTTIANLSLMSERQNILLVSAVLVLAGTIVFAADHARGGTPLTTSAQRKTWARRISLALVVLACVGLGLGTHTEALALGPFWALMAWCIWRARNSANWSGIQTTAVVFGLALVSLFVEIKFQASDGPQMPAIGDLMSLSKAQVDLTLDRHFAALHQYEDAHMPVVYAHSVVLAGAALLLLVLAVRRRVVGRFGKPSRDTEQSEPSR